MVDPCKSGLLRGDPGAVSGAVSSLFLRPDRWLLSLFLVLGPVTLVPAADPGQRPKGTTIDFARDVQPLLENNCWKCHGANRTENGLRLDRRDDLLKGGEHGPAAVVGQSGQSLLLHVVQGTHADLGRMPKKAEALSAAQIALLRVWIDEGLSWPVDTAAAEEKRKNHWAWRAPVRPVLPDTKASKWAQTPIDSFIESRLTAAGLAASLETDRITQLRRLHFDLTGLPPTPDEVDRFIADRTDGAYSRRVEELLASPHFGERWARHWLDAARYADSDGYEKDKPRFVWAYRDWVVGALNRDLPYDRFIIEQIAGDLLPDATPESAVATGFLRNSMLNEEGGVDPEQFRTDGLIDRMDCIGKSVLGITIQCAQCHNHKFDPISQEEYYRLFAYLNNDHESSRVYYPPDQAQQVGNLTRQIRDLEAGLRHTLPGWEQRMAAWEAEVISNQPPWEIVRSVNVSDNGERFYYYEDGSIRAASYAPTFWTARFRGTNHLASIGAIRLEQLTDPNLPCGGPGRSIKGMSALSGFKVTAEELGSTNKVEVKFVKVTADFANPEKRLEPEFQSESRNREKGDKRIYGPVQFAIDDQDDTAWGIDAGPGRRNVARQAVFIPERPIAFTNGVVLTFGLQQMHGGDNSDDNQNHNLGRWRISVTGDTNAVADVVPAAVREIFRIPPEQRSPNQVAVVFSYWRTTVPEFRETNERIESLWRQWPEGTPTQTLASRRGDGPGESMRATHLFKRGDWLKPGKEVTAGTPAFLHPLPTGADVSRLTLAHWLVDRRAPTTARVAVNRVWQQLFGTGLQETPEDFGLQSPPVSHPELLDWLAVEFMEPTVTFAAEAGSAPVPWSLKHLLRVCVNSAVYRQSSRVTPASYERDPYNRLLGRGPRFRVDAEVVRDVALAAAGLLNPTLGGRAVYPPAPDFLFKPPASYGPKVWNEEIGPDRYRRSLYTFRFRSAPYPVLQAFDAPNGDFSCVRRLRSNTPLQALTSLNEPLFVEAAQALARRAVTEGGASEDSRLTYAFRRVLQRQPHDSEKAILKKLLASQLARLGEGWVNPAELATGKSEVPKDLPPGVTPTQLAAYTSVSRALLNLDEAVTKE